MPAPVPTSTLALDSKSEVKTERTCRACHSATTLLPWPDCAPDTPVCEPCCQRIQTALEQWRTLSALSLRTSPLAALLLSREKCESALLRPWMTSQVSIGGPEIRFSRVVPWPELLRRVDDQGKDSQSGFLQVVQALSTHYGLQKSIEGRASEDRIPFVARDRAPCRRCDGCRSESVCQSNWYLAFIDGRNVPTAQGPVPLAIVCFPGHAPARENQVHESLLLEKVRVNDGALLGDVNIRVFPWSEFDRFRWEIGMTAAAADWYAAHVAKTKL
jgi:hypothetical protein